MTAAVFFLVVGVVAIWLDAHRERSAGLAGSSDVVDRDRERMRMDIHALD
ncbi:hypothetical protein [Lentzea sp. NBRC 105346]|nr:hypothetical protein [Lentzea sp. NBRC 105346]